MALYCGIDLHSNNHVVVVIDEADRRVFDRRLGNDLALTLNAQEPYRSELAGVAVKSTFNGYWLVDGLPAAGYPMWLVNTMAVQQYAGLKYTDDRYDAYWLAHWMRLGILPTGSIYPKEQRGIRDLLRRRMQLVQTASQQLISRQSQIWRQTGERIASSRLKQANSVVDLPGAAQKLAAQSTRQVYRAIARSTGIAGTCAVASRQTAVKLPAIDHSPRHRRHSGHDHCAGDKREGQQRPEER